MDVQFWLFFPICELPDSFPASPDSHRPECGEAWGIFSTSLPILILAFLADAHHCVRRMHPNWQSTFPIVFHGFPLFAVVPFPNLISRTTILEQVISDTRVIEHDATVLLVCFPFCLLHSMWLTEGYSTRCRDLHLRCRWSHPVDMACLNIVICGLKVSPKKGPSPANIVRKRSVNVSQVVITGSKSSDLFRDDDTETGAKFTLSTVHRSLGLRRLRLVC